MNIEEVLEAFGQPEKKNTEKDKTITRLRQVNEQQAATINDLRDRCSQMADRNLDLRNQLKAHGVQS
jgi:hypothetical protein